MPIVGANMEVLQTKDGYTFYVLDDGRVVDDLNPDYVDMSWPNIDSFNKTQGD